MVESNVRDNNPKERHLITNSEWPESAGGGKSTLKEKIMFSIFLIVLIIIVVIFLV